MAAAAIGAAAAMGGSGAHAGETHVVAMLGSDYSPARLTVRVGDTIRFVNDDVIDHTVFVATIDHAVDLGGQKAEETRELTLHQPGLFEVECVFHDHMLLTVEVLP